MNSEETAEFGKKWLIEEKYGGKITSKNRTAVEKDFERLNNGEPVDYVIGFVEFAGCKIDLSLRPLIPRVETEFWAEKAIDDILENIGIDSAVKCLDLFAGSGCVGIAILKQVPYVSVDFAEKEKGFIEQIKINLKLNGIGKDRYGLIQADIFDGVSGFYDYILANPPYIAESDKQTVQQSVLDWEPAGTIFGGKDGLFFIDKFLKEARKHLNKKGKVYMEFGSAQKDGVENLLKKYDYAGYDFFRDQFGNWRYMTADAKIK